MADFNHLYMSGLVKKAQRSDSDAFAELYALTYKHIYQYACRSLKDTYSAQDAVQEIYILALKNIHKIKDATLFVAWLNQIAFHVCFDMCKKRNQQYGEISPELLELSPDEYKDHNPESKVLQTDQTRSLQAAIDHLSFSEKQVIVMKFYNEMKLEDIAEAMQCSRSSVKRYLISAKKNLHQLLRAEHLSIEEANS